MPPKKQVPARAVKPSQPKPHPRRILSSDDDISAGVPFYDQLPKDMMEGSTQPFPSVGGPSQVSTDIMSTYKFN